MTESTRAGDPGVRELPLAAGGELELKLGANRVRIRTTDTDRVVIRGHTERDLERDVEITAGVGWVRIADGPAGSFRLGPITVRNGGHTPDLDIEVPRNIRLSGRTISGSIDAVGLNGPSRWQSASGTIRIGAEGGPVTIETMSGDAHVEGLGSLAVTARTVSGSVKIRSDRLSALDVATTSGDISVDGALDEGVLHSLASVSGDVRLVTGSEVTVTLQSVAGDIKASMPHRSDGARGRRTVVVGSGRVRVDVKTLSGDVRLQPGEPDLAEPGPAGPSAPRPTFWADFGRDWAESARDWAESWREWGQAWASGRAGPSSSPAAPPRPSAPQPPVPPAAPSGATASDTSAGDSTPAATPIAPAPPAAPQDPAMADPQAGAETAPVPSPTAADVEAARLDVLRALERGELDVEDAADRLAALEGLGREEATRA